MPARGRPTKFKTEYVDQAYRHCLLGATDAELALLFKVNVDTITEWKKVHPEFSVSINAGRDEADAHVAHAMYHRALGYKHEAVKIFMPAGAENPVYAPYVEHYPPDTQAGSLWLRNRQSAKWRDVQRQEHTGPDGGAIKVEPDLSGLTDEQKRAIASIKLPADR
jgi:hypothetical protein